MLSYYHSDFTFSPHFMSRRWCHHIFHRESRSQQSGIQHPFTKYVKLILHLPFFLLHFHYNVRETPCINSIICVPISSAFSEMLIVSHLPYYFNLFLMALIFAFKHLFHLNPATCLFIYLSPAQQQPKLK